MRKLIFILFISVFLIGCSKTVNKDEVVYNGSIKKLVLKNTDNKLFTGYVLCHDHKGILKYKLKFNKGENVSKDISLTLNSICNIEHEPYNYYFELLYDSTGIFMKDLYVPFTGTLIINTYNDTIDYNQDINIELSYVNGFLNGKQKEYFEDGHLKSEYNYINRVLNGEYKSYYENGNLKENISFINGEASGICIQYHDNGQIISKVNYHEGNIIDDEVRKFWKTGKIKLILKYKDGQLEGLQKEYYPDEKIKSEKYYISGKQNGEWKYYKENGELLDSGKIIDGTGVIRDYFDNKKMKSETNYKNEKIDGKVIEYYENGNIKKDINYINGEYNGKYITYYENGHIEEKSNYKNGKLDGKHYTYFENGKIHEEETYNNGLKNGWSLTYTETGRLEYDFFYENGKYKYKEYKPINPKIPKYIKFIQAKLEKYDEDYKRDSGSHRAHVRAYFQFKNISSKEIAAIQFDFTFKDLFGDNLYNSSAKYDIKLLPNEINPLNYYWYWEDSYSSPYKNLWSPVASGNVKTEVEVTKIVFSDGTVIE